MTTEKHYLISESELLELLHCQNLLGAYIQLTDLDFDVVEDYLDLAVVAEELNTMYLQFDNQPKGN